MSVTIEQGNITSSVSLLFKTIGRTPLEKEIELQDLNMVIWQDYLIGSYIRTRNKKSYGLLVWNIKETAPYYFEVCQPPSLQPCALNSNSLDAILPIPSQSL
jgi:hypothetical protein